MGRESPMSEGILAGWRRRLFQSVDKLVHPRGQVFLFPVNDGQQFGAGAGGTVTTTDPFPNEGADRFTT
jgi:hypothetical protein